MNIFKNDSIEFPPTEREEKSSNLPLNFELSDSVLMDANPFAFLKENIMGMLPELALLIEEQQLKRIKEKEDNIEQLKSQIDQMEFLLMSNDFSPVSKDPVVFPKELASLEQNLPNPFMDKTMINCFVPSSAVEALLKIINDDGQIAKSVLIVHRGNVQLEIDSYGLQSGNFTYQLVADHKVLLSKVMTVVK